MISLKNILLEAASTETYWANIVQNKKRYPQYHDLPNEKDAELRAELLDPSTPSSRKEAIRKIFIESMLTTAFYAARAQAYKFKNVSWEEAFGDAQMGIVDAFRTMDWNRPVLFKTHATTRINAETRNAFYDYANTVRVPMDVQQTFAAAQAAELRDNPEAEYQPLQIRKSVTKKTDDGSDGEEYLSGDLNADAIVLTDDQQKKIKNYFANLRKDLDPKSKKWQMIVTAEKLASHLFGIDGYEQLTPKELAAKENTREETIHNILRKYVPFYKDFYKD